MKTCIRATAVLGLPAVVICCWLPGVTVAAASTVAPLPASNYTVRPVCAAPAPGHAGCLALRLVPVTAAARARVHPLASKSSARTGVITAAECVVAYASTCLSPQRLHSAYALPTTAPSVQTIAIVDAYNDLNAEADLRVYDKEFGLPECPESNKCLGKVNQNGETGNLPFPESEASRVTKEAVCKTAIEPVAGEACKEVEEADGWAGEISLDIEVAHAVCQNCHIVLVEVNSSSFLDLEEGEKTAARLGATEISNSWGGPECSEGLSGLECFPDSPAFDQQGIVITAAAGDNGYLDWAAESPSERDFADYPASSPHVVAVGGTRLNLTAAGAWKEETVWNGNGAGGGGCSTVLTAAPWQQEVTDWSSVGCGEHRAVADVSADADPYTGVAIYDSTPESRP
jgi:subtilase family serine protease